jgi:hypothetical protein
MVKAKVKGYDDYEVDSDESAEAELESDDEAEPLLTDDDEETAAEGDDLPEGFSETDPELEDDGADADSVPRVEDEEEFPEDEIGEIAGDKEDDDSGR